MKTIKLLTLVIGIMLLASGIEASAQKNEKTLGVRTGYVSRNKSAIAGIYFQYSFSDHFRLAPDAQCVFRNNDKDAFMFDIDAHFPFRFTDTKRLALYPIAGINYSSWNEHTQNNAPEDEDVSTRTARFGLNAGAGFELKASPTLKISIEARYSFVKANSTVLISAGIGYIF